MISHYPGETVNHCPVVISPPLMRKKKICRKTAQREASSKREPELAMGEASPLRHEQASQKRSAKSGAHRMSPSLSLL